MILKAGIGILWNFQSADRLYCRGQKSLRLRTIIKVSVDVAERVIVNGGDCVEERLL